MSKSNKPHVPGRASRRDFLKTTGAVAGAAIAGNLAIGRSAHAAGSDVLKIGLVGCGGQGSGMANAALEADKNTKLTAMADLFEDKVKGSRKRLKKIKGDQVAVDDDHCFVGFDAYQKLIDSGVDVVVLGTTPRFRPEHLAACVKADKHVFCEKPVAVDAPGIRSVLATCEEAEKKNLNIVSGLCWRYHPGVKETMQRVLDGAIGDILSIQETYITCPVGHPVPRDSVKSEMEFQLRCWQFFAWLSGDHNVEQHIHSLDKAAWAMHEEPPVCAWGLGGKQLPKLGDIYDHHAVVYEYPSGMRVHAYCRQQAGCYNETSDEFVGTKGTCNVLKHRIEGENPWRYRGPKGNMYLLEHEALFEAIRGGKTINNGLYMARSTMLAILGRMATYTGQKVTWEEALNSEHTVAPARYGWDVDPPTMPDADGNYQSAMPGVTRLG
jgi:predicted dehydrogenase